MGISISIQLNNPTKTLPKIGDDSINVDIIGMVKAHLQLSTNKTILKVPGCSPGLFWWSPLTLGAA